MFVKEAFKGGAAGVLDGFEGGPAFKEVAEENVVFVLEPQQGLGIIVLECHGEAIGDACLVVD